MALFKGEHPILHWNRETGRLYNSGQINLEQSIRRSALQQIYMNDVPQNDQNIHTFELFKRNFDNKRIWTLKQLKKWINKVVRPFMMFGYNNPIQDLGLSNLIIWSWNQPAREIRERQNFNGRTLAEIERQNRNRSLFDDLRNIQQPQQTQEQIDQELRDFLASRPQPKQKTKPIPKTGKGKHKSISKNLLVDSDSGTDSESDYDY
jgi:hypothetical protein